MLDQPKDVVPRGVGEVVTQVSPSGIRKDLPAIVHLTERFHPGLADPSGLSPLLGSELYHYRQYLEVCAPRVAEFAASIRRSLWAGTMAVVVERLGIAEASLAEKRILLYALGCLIGRPTATDPHARKVLWDIKATTFGEEYFPTFSEHNQEADFHTDTQYYANPERYLMLYAVRAAQCGGGLSYFADSEAIFRRLMETPDGRSAIAVLSAIKVPFRIPSAFAETAEREYTWARVIADEPRLRFRTDTIRDGLEQISAAERGRLNRAVLCFVAAAEAVATQRSLLPDDGIVFFNNHECLHARTGFSDAERHLIRVRMHG